MELKSSMEHVHLVTFDNGNQEVFLACSFSEIENYIGKNMGRSSPRIKTISRLGLLRVTKNEGE